MKLRRTFSVFTLALLLGACASSADKKLRDAQHPAVLFPLAVGQYWIYQISLNAEDATIENRISSSRSIGDTEWFLSVEYGENFWIRNTVEGQVEAVNLYTRDEDSAIFQQLDAKAIREELLYKFPALAGDRWITLENTLHYEGKQTITVPAGTFECHAYAISLNHADKPYSHSCIAEGIGVIYSDNLLPDGTLEVSRLKHWGSRK